jgi:hypothetical protein
MNKISRLKVEEYCEKKIYQDDDREGLIRMIYTTISLELGGAEEEVLCVFENYPLIIPSKLHWRSSR